MLARLVRFAAPVTFSLTLVALGLAAAATSQPPSQTETGLTVHEWGTFTSVAGEGGRALQWRPLSVESDLPSFVYSVDSGNTWRGLRYPQKSGMPVSVRMETPVIYFYGSEPARVSVNVRFPSGRITEWFPRAQVNRELIEWKNLLISPRMHIALPHDLRENHYYPARETEAAVVQTDTGTHLEHEKFLFYRGVGNFELPLAVRIESGKLVIKAAGEAKIGKVIAFENRGGQSGYRISNLSSDELVIERPELSNDNPALRRDLKNMLVDAGLFDKEAEAMLNTWRDSWFEEGLRIFYLVPPKITDEVLPISIDPKPEQLVRVLVGRTEVLTPEMAKNVTMQIARLHDPSRAIRESAHNEIRKYGRFLEPLLTEVLQHSRDQQFKDDILLLLAELEQRTLERRSAKR